MKCEKLHRVAIGNKSIDRRHHPRSSIRTDASLRKCPHCLGLGPLIDISLGGVSFHYEKKDIDLNFTSIDIYFGNDIFVLEKVPCLQIITPQDHKGDKSLYSIPVSRIGVQFGPLTPGLAKQLNYFLKLNALFSNNMILKTSHSF